MKGYHQAVLLKASGNPILVGYECRPHTIPVKQSTPRIFNGEVVPPGATHYVYKYGHLSFVTYVEGVPYWNSVESYDRTNQTLTMPQVGSILHQDIKSLPEQEKNMSELFGKKYKVTEETITLLLNALMTQGSDILGIPLSSNQLYVYEDGHVSHGSKLGDEYFANHRLPEAVLEVVKTIKLRAVIHPKSPEQLAYEQLQAQIADEETRHSKSMKALRERAEKLKPKQ